MDETDNSNTPENDTVTPPVSKKHKYRKDKRTY